MAQSFVNKLMIDNENELYKDFTIRLCLLKLNKKDRTIPKTY